MASSKLVVVSIDPFFGAHPFLVKMTEDQREEIRKTLSRLLDQGLIANFSMRFLANDEPIPYREFTALLRRFEDTGERP